LQEARRGALKDIEAYYGDAADAYGGSCSCPRCGAPMQHRGLRPLWVTTLAGVVRVYRHYYWCKADGAGCAPFDEALGLYRGYTRAVQRVVAFLAAITSFGEAARMLRRMLGITLDKNTVRDIARYLAAAYEERQQRACRTIKDIMGAAPFVERLYIEIDAAKFHAVDDWRDTKVGVVFDVRQVNGVQHVNDKTYVAGNEHIDAFGARFFAHAARRGVCNAREVIALADGAPYNWAMVDLHFPHAVQILDIYHAYEHLATLRHCAWREDDPVGRAWYRAQKRRLKAGYRDAFFSHFDNVPCATDEQRTCRRTTIGYFQDNRLRIRYGEFRRKGYFIGSGVVESGCKRIVTQRLKLPGARWLRNNAHLMAQLRAAYLNDYLDDIGKFMLAA